MILQHVMIVTGREGGLLDDEPVQFQKAIISKLSLVCRAWCRQFRPLLFANLVLYNAHDFNFLHALRQSPLSGWLLEHISLVDHSSIPRFYSAPIWLATLRLFPSLYHISRNTAVEIIHSTRPSDTAEYRRLRGLRSLHSLALSDCRFPSFSALIRTFGSMPHLQKIELDTVRWPRVIHTAYNPLICDASFANICHIRARNCTDNVAISAVIFTAASTHHPYVRRPTNQGAQISSEVSAIFSLLLDDLFRSRIVLPDEWQEASKVDGSAGA